MYHKLYSEAITSLLNGSISDLTVPATEIRIAIMKEGFVFNQEHQTWNDIKVWESDSADHPSGGIEITDKVVTRGERVTTFSTTLPTLSFGAVTMSGTHAVVYKYINDGGNPRDDSPLLSCIFFGGVESREGNPWDMDVPEDGFIQITVAA